MKKKAQTELAVMGGLFIVMLVTTGFYITDAISGVNQISLTNGGEFVCTWDCSSVEWSDCIGGYQHKDVGDCSNPETCKCYVNRDECYSVSQQPKTLRICIYILK